MVERELTGEDVAGELIQLRQAIDELEVRFARLSVEFDRTSWWDYEGFNTAADWIRFNCHMNSPAVWNAFAVGANEREMPATLDSMRSGEIGYAHVATMARTAAEVGGAFDEAVLLPLAKAHSPGRFFHKCIHYRHSVDASGYARDQEKLAEQRGLRLNTAQDGCLLIKGMAGAAAAEMEFSLPISSATVRRMACDCNVTRVLLSEESTVIDVGRSRRLVDGTLRKALAIRDKHCQWPGCERPASWCDGHHLVHWADGGATNLDNCMLLCKRHHRMVHEGGWKLVKVNGRVVPIAPTVTFGRPEG